MPPATAEGAAAVWVNVSAAAATTVTVAVHRASGPLAGQLLPGVAEVTVLARDWSPVSGVFTVTV